MGWRVMHRVTPRAELHRSTLIPEKDIKDAYKHIDRSLHGFTAATANSSSTMTSTEALVVRALANARVRASDHVLRACARQRRMCAAFKLPPTTEELCVTVVNNMRQYAEGRLPRTLAASALSMVLAHSPPTKVKRPTELEIAEAAEIAVGTGVLCALRHDTSVFHS
jgi:hypothetical protein